MRNLLKTGALGLAGACALLASNAVVAEPLVITNAKIYLAGSSNDPQTIDNGGLVIEDGKITAIGVEVSVPAGAKVIDAGGKPVTPGLFAALSGLGLEEISLNREGNDRSVRGAFSLSAAIDATDALNTDSSIIPISRVGGVTRAYVTPDPGQKLFGGCGAVIDLSGSVDPVTSACIAQNTVMGFAGAVRAGGSKAAALSLLRSYLDEVALYQQSPADYRFLMSASDLSPADLKALVPYLEGEKPLLVAVESAPDILRLIRLKDKYGLDLVLYNAREAWRVAGALAAADIPVIINPLDNLPTGFETMGATLKNAARLEKAGVLVAYYDSDIGYTHNLRLLPQLAGNAVANGTSYEGALAAITLNPAKIWGLDDQLGTLQTGKIADVVIWDGDPLEVTSRPQSVIIGGKVMPLETRQTILVRRYKDLDRGDKPFAYRGR